MDQFHKNLKHDKFVEQVGELSHFATDHRSQVVKYAGAAVLVLALALGAYWYSSHAAEQRQAELTQALRIQTANVAAEAASGDFVLNFKTQAEKDAAANKAFSELASKYGNKTEGIVAKIYLGIIASDAGKAAEAEKYWQDAANSGDKPLASQAKLSLASLYSSQGKTAEAEKLLRSIMDNPTPLVSKEQATISLARVLAKTRPDEAKKLLEPLRSERSAVSRMALTALAEIPGR